MTTSTSNNYPFQTKAQISARLVNDDAFTLQSFQVLLSSQTPEEKAAGSAAEKNGVGLSSSDSVKVKRLIADLISAGEPISPDTLNLSDISDGGKSTVLTFCRQSLMCGRGIGSYAKQLASHYRAVELTEDPSKAAAAAVFFQDNTKK
jgi:hypothetical protein